jgi:hypothetical protein
MTDDEHMETPEVKVGQAEQRANSLISEFKGLLKKPDTEPLVSSLFLYLVASNFEGMAKQIDRDRREVA